MAHWKTYVGFFQHGETESVLAEGTRSTHYYNFYPVMERVGDVFKQDFPNQTFYRGRMQLKRLNEEYGTQANIMIEEINQDLECNVLTVVSFDENKFFKESEDEYFYMGILLDSDDYVRSAIKLENISFDDIFGSSYHALIPVENLDPAGNYGAGAILKSRCVIRENPLGFQAYPCILRCDQLISNPLTAKISSGFHKTYPWIEGKSVDKLYEFQEGITYGIALPYAVDTESWDAGHYAATNDVELVELRHSASPIKGILEYISKDKGYILKMAKGVRIASAAGSVSKISMQYGFDFLSQTTTFLQESGRDVTKADVINYCICLTQGFITTFAGAPGTGKTTLCRLLARAMGLEEESGQYESAARYAEISVERGWTSLRDFIGYPNPFPVADASATGDDIVASNIDACHAFRRMNENWQKETPDAPAYLMLLDEANLSPIEYYWSQFLRNCQLDEPDELEKRKINVSQREAWKLSPNLRFLATVNFDHTTEELSPRFLDRSWVITLKSPDRLPACVKPAMPKTVPMSELNRLFGYPKEGEVFPERLTAAWTQIRQAFREKPVNMPLSPRNVLAVERYCIAAARFPENEITLEQALDFAVLQKVLPTISGFGERFEVLVGRLIDIAKEHRLQCTQEKLEEMNDAANANSQFYQFFIR